MIIRVPKPLGFVQDVDFSNLSAMAGLNTQVRLSQGGGTPTTAQTINTLITAGSVMVNGERVYVRRQGATNTVRFYKQSATPLDIAVPGTRLKTFNFVHTDALNDIHKIYSFSLTGWLTGANRRMQVTFSSGGFSSSFFINHSDVTNDSKREILRVIHSRLGQNGLALGTDRVYTDDWFASLGFYKDLTNDLSIDIDYQETNILGAWTSPNSKNFTLTDQSDGTITINNSDLNQSVNNNAGITGGGRNLVMPIDTTNNYADTGNGRLLLAQANTTNFGNNGGITGNNRTLVLPENHSHIYNNSTTITGNDRNLLIQRNSDITATDGADTSLVFHIDRHRSYSDDPAITGDDDELIIDQLQTDRHATGTTNKGLVIPGASNIILSDDVGLEHRDRDDVDNPPSEAIASYLELTPVPQGLTPKFSWRSESQIELELTGQAISHSGENDILDARVVAKAGAFKSKLAADVLKPITMDFIDEINISRNQNSFVESSANDGTIANKLTFDVGGGAKLRFVTRVLPHGFILSLPSSITDDLIIGGKTIEIDKSKSAQGLREEVVNFINNGGQGTLTQQGRLYAKAVGSTILLLKDSADDIVVNMQGANSTLQRSTSLEEEDRTIRLIDPTLNLNDGAGITITPAVPNNLKAEFRAINLTQIEMVLKDSAISHNPSATPTDNRTVQVGFTNAIFQGTTRFYRWTKSCHQYQLYR